jgi:hypothetical protein
MADRTGSSSLISKDEKCTDFNFEILFFKFFLKAIFLIWIGHAKLDESTIRNQVGRKTGSEIFFRTKLDQVRETGRQP